MTPAGIFVAPDSKIRRPEDLANVPITVGYQSGSHYTTIQALEPVLKREEIKVHFGGTLFLRLVSDRREVPWQRYSARPCIWPNNSDIERFWMLLHDCATVLENTAEEDVLKYYRA